jgi:hypothetical protein
VDVAAVAVEAEPPLMLSSDAMADESWLEGEDPLSERLDADDCELESRPKSAWMMACTAERAAACTAALVGVVDAVAVVGVAVDDELVPALGTIRRMVSMPESPTQSFSFCT